MDFQVGDRVVCLKRYSGVQSGEHGIIQHIIGDGESTCDIYVRWDKYREERHTNSGRCKAGHGWRVSYYDIEHEKALDLGELPSVSNSLEKFLYEGTVV